MTIAAIVLWMAMQGQLVQSKPVFTCNGNPACCGNEKPDGSCPVDDKPYSAQLPNYPAEHVDPCKPFIGAHVFFEFFG